MAYLVMKSYKMVTYFLVLVIPPGHLVMISKMVMYRQLWIQRAELVMKRGNGYCFQFFGDEINQSLSRTLLRENSAFFEAFEGVHEGSPSTNNGWKL